MERYDKDTGQVYIETTQPVRSMVSWAITSRGKRDDPAQYRNPVQGVPSLQAMALRSCIWNAECFMPETLQVAGWHYAERMLRKMKQNDTLTFAAWSIFRIAFPAEVERNYHLYFPAGRSSHPSNLVSIVKRLSRISFECLSFLTIRNLQLRSDHLMSLITISNLAVLALEQDPANLFLNDDGNIDDRFMRNWGRAVHEKGAFTKLKVLIFRHFSPGTESTFRGLEQFPALYLVNIDSWCLEQETRRMKTGKVIDHGKWRCLPTDGSEQRSSRYENPETTWKRADITSQNKMEILYNLANRYLEDSSTESSNEGYVSIDYGDATSRNHPKSLSAWFVRSPVFANELANPVKRSEITDVRLEDLQNGQTKKRKVKDVRKKDIGSFLGTFS